MKANRNSGGLKMLLLKHCEKAFTLGLVAVAAWLGYSSLNVPVEERRPERLADTVTQTRSAFTDSTRDKVPEEEFLVAYDPASKDSARIAPDAYAGSGAGWNPPVVPPTVDRVDPPLLAATGLEGSAITGLMAFVNDEIREKIRREEARRAELDRLEQEKQQESQRNDPLDNIRGGRGGLGGLGGLDEGDGKRRRVSSRAGQAGVAVQGVELIQRVSCAIVLAKAPSLKQFDLYKEALENARGYNPSADVPTYLGYYVERAEVGKDEALDWKPVGVGSITGGKRSKVLTAKTIETMTADWVGGQAPLVDSRYDNPSLTVPLPPLVGKDWGAEVVHSEAPLQSETDAAAARAEQEEPDSPAIGGEQPDDSPFDLDPRRGPGRAGARGRSGALRGGRGMAGDPRMRGMEGAPSMRGEFGPRGGRGSIGGRGAIGGRGGRSASDFSGFSPDIDFQMVRFFDFTVAPGKRYRYRVRLVLQDVNDAVDQRYLAREVIERRDELKRSMRRVRLAEWSEPSPVITVPMAGDVFVDAVKPPSAKVAGAEGSIDLLVQSFALDEEQRAIRVALEQSFRRGAVMNMTKDAEFVDPTGQWIDEIDSFQFRTGITLVDYDGGQSISRDFSAPGRVLLMSAGGELFIRNELDDAEAIRTHKDLFAEDDGLGDGRMEMMRGPQSIP